MSKIAIIFSGQGSQDIKMGQTFKESETYSRTIEQIAQVRTDLQYLLTTTNAEEINDTLNAQIALFANQIAIYQELAQRFELDNVAYAGFSLGEYTAMCAAGVLKLEEMAQVIDKRSLAMSKENGNGTMKAVIGLKYDELSSAIQSLNQEHNTNIQIANYNQENQIVLAGTKSDFDKIEEQLKELKVRIIELKVSGAFHTDLFKNCAQQFTQEINEMDFKPVENLYSNVTAKQLLEIDVDYLAKHMTTGVNWYPQIKQMISDGIDTFVEINEKSTLLPMIKRIDRKVNLIHIKEMDDLNKLEDLWNKR